MTLPEHLLWFVVLSLFVFLVYNALRVDSLREAVHRGVRRWLVFVAGTAALALVFTLLSHFL